MNANKVRVKKGLLVAIPLAFGLILAVAALFSVPVSIGQKEVQTESFLFFDGTDSPSRLEPSQGNLPISFNGMSNSTIFQIEINCDAPILITLFDLNNIPFNETRDFLMQILVSAGNSTYYWTPVFEKVEPYSHQNYLIQIAALERTTLVGAKIAGFSYEQVTVINIVYQSLVEPYFGYVGLASIVFALVAQWKSEDGNKS